jgi:hypothetical protein
MNVDQADYDLWKAGFGTAVPGGVGLGSSAAVPEPAALAFLAPIATMLCSARRKRCR